MEEEIQSSSQLEKELGSSGNEKVGKQEETVTSEDLARYLFGLPLKEENFEVIIDKMEEDQKEIRALYGLPPLDMLKSDPAEFERRIREIAFKNGFRIISKLECGNFFDKNPAEGVFFEDQSKIGVDIDRNDTRETYIRSLLTLEHELVHALQSLRYPRMPLEIMEYQAYVSNASIGKLRRDPSLLKDAFFDFFLGGSVRIGYRLVNEEREKRGLPKILPESKKPMK